MVNRTRRSAIAAARKVAIAAGYYIREGAYVGTTDNVLGRWYFGHGDFSGFRPYGRGHASRSAAWLAAAEHMASVAEV